MWLDVLFPSVSCCEPCFEDVFWSLRKTRRLSSSVSKLLAQGDDRSFIARYHAGWPGLAWEKVKSSDIWRELEVELHHSESSGEIVWAPPIGGPAVTKNTLEGLYFWPGNFLGCWWEEGCLGYYGWMYRWMDVNHWQVYGSFLIKDTYVIEWHHHSVVIFLSTWWIIHSSLALHMSY